MNPTPLSAPTLDMQDLVLHTQRLVESWQSGCSERSVRSWSTQPARMRPARQSRQPTHVLADDVGVELGPPTEASCSLVLRTSDLSLVHTGRVTLVGPDLPQTEPGTRLSFAQVVVVGIASEATPDPFTLENLSFLTHRLPGYMARSIPGRLWVRISRETHAHGLTFRTVGEALISAYLSEVPEVAFAEVLFVTSSRDDVAALAPIALAAEVVARHHRKLALSEDGDLSCVDMTCDTCEEKPVCDGLREMIQHRRSSP
jgi:CO dehydrogenase/acetyl-CoA synthase beta subunit